MIVVTFTELSIRFWGKDSEFDLSHVSEVPWRFPNEDVEKHIRHIGLGLAWSNKFTKYLQQLLIESMCTDEIIDGESIDL